MYFLRHEMARDENIRTFAECTLRFDLRGIQGRIPVDKVTAYVHSQTLAFMDTMHAQGLQYNQTK